MVNQSSVDGFTLLGIFFHSPADLVLFSVVMVVFTVALCGNVLLIFLIYMDPRLHTPMYFFLSQLSFIDLMLVCTNVPKVAVNLLSGKKSISFMGCGTQICFSVTLVGSEGLLLGLMAYDLSVAISHPLHYPILMNQRLCFQIVEGSWAFGIIDGLILMVVIMTFSYCGSREVNHFFCEMLSLLRLACADTSLIENMIFACCVFLLFLSFSNIVATYSQILKAVLHIHSAQASKKALATCSSHLTAVSLFYGAAMFIYPRSSCYRAPSHDKVVLTLMFKPFIYSSRNREVMGDLRKGWTIAGLTASTQGSEHPVPDSETSWLCDIG